MDCNIPVREGGGVGYVVQGSECCCCSVEIFTVCCIKQNNE